MNYKHNHYYSTPSSLSTYDLFIHSSRLFLLTHASHCISGNSNIVCTCRICIVGSTIFRIFHRAFCLHLPVEWTLIFSYELDTAYEMIIFAAKYINKNQILWVFILGSVCLLFPSIFLDDFPFFYGRNVLRGTDFPITDERLFFFFSN